MSGIWLNRRVVRGVVVWVAAALVLPATYEPAEAQSSFGLAAGASFERYDFSDSEAAGIESLSLISFPFSARARFTPQLRLEINGAYAMGGLTRAGAEEQTISGPTDTEARLSYAFGADRLVLSAIALIPTGLTTLSAEEADVAGAIAADVLPFRISNWGTGGGLGLSSAVAAPMGEFAVGISAGYVVAREFEPSDATEFTYRPGNQLYAAAAIDRTFGSSGKASLRVGYYSFQDDELDGANLYRSGDRLDATASYAFAAGARAAGIVYAGWLRRGEGEFTDETRIVPAQDLIFTGLGFRMPIGRGVLAPAVDFRLVDRADGAEEGYVATIGTSAELPAGSVTIVPSVRGRFGNAVLNADIETGFTGFDVGLGLRFGAVR